MKDESALLPLVAKFLESDPNAAAHAIETMSEDEAIAILKAVSPTLAAQIVRSTENAFSASLLKKLPRSFYKPIIEKLDSHQCATILLNFTGEDRTVFLECLEEKRKKEVQDILNYPEDSAGRIMTTDFIAFHSDIHVRDAIQKIRLLAQKGAQASYIYVVDRDNRLIGIMNMRDMMLADGSATLESMMRKKVFAVNCFMDREAVALELSQRRYFAVPVVDNDNHLLGVVKVEHLIEGVQEEATEDIQKMFGAGGDERAFSPIRFSLRMRLPWLHVNLATAFLAASVVALFEGLIAKITILAVFLPIVAGQGGNAGAQSLAVVIRSLVMREIPKEKFKALLIKETTIGIVNGVVIGLVTAGIAWAWHGNPYLGLVIGLGMLVNLAMAGLSGAAIPVIMKSFGLDPAQCSSIILTTVTDVMGFFSFLGFALLFQDKLL